MPHISVIVPFYNAERYIQDCIDGLLRQHYPQDAYEIIMVDNNSTDASAEIVKRSPRIKLLTEKKQGSYAARNRGLAVAQGDIIAFTDPDCIPEANWLCNIAAALASGDVRVVLGERQMARESVCLSLLAAYEHQKLRFVFASRAKELYFGYTNNMAVRREVFTRVGPFAERERGADQIFVYHVASQYSSDVIRYDTAIRVRHLEMDSAWGYFHKQFLYGWSNRLCSEIVAVRPLLLRERLQIIRQAIGDGGYSWPSAGLLLLLLVLGGVYYSLGRWTAAWSAQRKVAPTLSKSDERLQPGNH